MPLCSVCGDPAESMVYRGDSQEYPTDSVIRICHAPNGAYLHILDE